MFLVRVITAATLLSVAYSANDPSLRFFFPSSQLFLGDHSGGGGGHGHRVSSVSGEPVDGTKGGGHGSSNRENQQEEATPGIKEPSKCVWAIISCCVAGSQRVNVECFEEKGCHGNFWDQSPCRRESAATAYRIAMRYYELKAAMKREESMAPGINAPSMQGAPEPTPHSPFDPIGPLPSREEAGIQ